MVAAAATRVARCLRKNPVGERSKAESPLHARPLDMRCDNSDAPRISTFGFSCWWRGRRLSPGLRRRLVGRRRAAAAVLTGYVCRHPALSWSTLADKRWRGCAAPRPTPTPPQGGTSEVAWHSSALPSARAARHGLSRDLAPTAPFVHAAHCSPPPHPGARRRQQY